MNGRRAARSFTLIELLVVVSILALLIALLLPAIKKARETARATMCLSNHRQLLVAISNYAGDFEAIVTPSYDYSTNQTWIRRIADYLPSLLGDPDAGIFGSSSPPPEVRTVAHCPSESTHGGPVLRADGFAHYGNIREDYALNGTRAGRVNAGGGGWSGWPHAGRTDFYTLEVQNQWPAPPTQRREQVYLGVPSDTFLIGDSVYMDIEPSDTFFQMLTNHALIYRHHGGTSAGLAFFDGHAEQRAKPIAPNGGPPVDNSMPVNAPW